ncbi:hypothetical protein WICPIJ_002863 [Wickerhamomyces pijperi]|uniref:OBG-type G domain-containing protein n=1 Tax=Wickerhamomyces pijperi TaxID=599730 RepID=A0A9P8QB04_WICPI|nr:hypothetical protein WICPIJ_002863 [Wickerhamomyces pijperi]
MPPIKIPKPTQVSRFFTTSALNLAKKPSGKDQGSSTATTLLGRTSNKLSIGIVGLANVGKSTFFQSITKTNLGNPNNYPFATIKPEESIYPVPSQKLKDLQKVFESDKALTSYLKIVDIAGLVRNASKGEGLGNQFLADIQNTDGIFHIVRGFDDEEVIHVEVNVDPVRDMEIVNDELILKDLALIESAAAKLTKSMKSVSGEERKNAEFELAALEKFEELFYEHNKGLINFVNELTDKEIEVVNKYHFLTAKPTLYLLNVSPEDFESNTNKYYDSVSQWISENSPSSKLLMFSANHEHALLDTNDESQIINEMVTIMKDELNLISFYTCGPKEAREWNIRRLSNIKSAAALIHTDLAKGFLNVQVAKYEDLMKMQPEETIKWNKHGKDYEVKDGDVIVIKAIGAKTR